MENNKVRILNGYRVIYLPEYHSAMTNDNWHGWVYEHIVVAEKYLKRHLRSGEVVHHLDFNRSNNRKENLLVLEHGQHSKLHTWLDKGAPGWEHSGMNRMNSGKSKSNKNTYCLVCDSFLQEKQLKYCSDKCCKLDTRKVEWPTPDQLKEDIDTLNWEAIGRKYKVSSNAARNWARQYGLI